MKVLVLGGTGVISRAIVERLLEKNYEVTVFNRGKRNLLFSGEVEQIVGDKTDRPEFEKTMKKLKFDSVIDMLCFNEEDAKSTVRAFKDNAGQIIITSSVAAYKRPYHTVPTVEESEELWDNPEFQYAFQKAEMERYLHTVIKEKKLPITIIRPSLTYGPGAANIGILRQNYGIIDRIKKGKPLVMFGDGSTSWNFTFAPDLARGYAELAGNKNAYGQVYHITNEDRHIWEDLYLEFGRIVGKEPVIIHIPSELLYKTAPNLCNHLYFEKTFAGLFDNSKIKKDAPLFKTEISLHTGLSSIADWFEREANTIDPEKEALEDKLVNAYNNFAVQISHLYTK
jgi:nucleoside-diphosphate-sugar epimerase